MTSDDCLEFQARSRSRFNVGYNYKLPGPFGLLLGSDGAISPESIFVWHFA